LVKFHVILKKKFQIQINLRKKKRNKMNSIIIALCLVLASVQLSYQQSPASIFDAAETGALELSNVNLAGVIYFDSLRFIKYRLIEII
jgi:hypothetical protein